MLILAPPTPSHKFAKYFISLVDEEAGDSISNLKLQKLLYYAQGFHLAIYDKPLFPEAIKKWAHGPVVPQIYHLYKEHGSNPIPLTQVNLNDYSKEQKELLDEVYSVYGQFTAAKLRQMTHQEPPWSDAPENGEISQESMKKFFKTLVITDEHQT
jgi:uncharacterized phage-associated protein